MAPRLGVKTLFIEYGSPWENGYIESFNSKLRDELLNGEIFDTILQARVVTGAWRKQKNTKATQLAGVSATSNRNILPPSGGQCLRSGEKRTQHWHHHRDLVTSPCTEVSWPNSLFPHTRYPEAAVTAVRSSAPHWYRTFVP